MNFAFYDNPSKVDKTADDLVLYEDLAATQYNFLTEENGCKWRYSDQYDRARCVFMLELAEKHSMAFRGHALVWGKAASNPDFFDEECVPDGDGNMPGRCKSEVGSYTVAEKYEIMNDHIKEEAEFYNTRLAAWDVVNEAVCDCWLSFEDCEAFAAANPDKCGVSELYSDMSEGGIKVYLKKNIYWPDMPDYIGVAFEETKKYDTTALLGYNEYKFEAAQGWQKGKSDMTYQLIKSLKEQNVPIDYVGSQTHIDLGYMTYNEYDNFETDTEYLAAVKENMDRYAAIGVQWHFTELTIAMEAATDTFDATAEANQAFLYQGLLGLCLNEDLCTCFQTWGYVDGWTLAYGGLLPYPFGTDYTGKQAFTDMMTLLDPLYGKERCVQQWSECTASSGCCTEGDECYARTTSYSQCRPSCPSGAAWLCDSADEGGDGSEGGLPGGAAGEALAAGIAVGLSGVFAFVLFKKICPTTHVGRNKKDIDGDTHMLNDSKL
jgi:endo-1,4-beta-xylanase